MRPASHSDHASRVTRHVLLVLLACATAVAQDAAELELDHTLSMEFETPHVQWAKPYARGKIRVLFFCNGRGTVPREAVELMQRFDFEIDAVFWRRIVDSTREGWHGGDLGLKRMLRLAAKPYDCYVFFGIRPNQLTAETQFKALQPVVEGGKGIVLVGVNDKRILKPNRRLEKLSPFLAQAEPQGAFRVGKGRGVLLPSRPKIEYDLGWQLRYESWQERLGRAIVWAAGREPEITLTHGRAVMWLRPGEAKTINVPALQWKNPSKKALRVGASIYAADGRCVLDQVSSTTVDRAEGRESFPMNPLRLDAGEYLYRVFLRGPRGVEAWAVRPYRVQFDEFAVRELALDRTWGEIGGRIKGSVRLANPDAAKGMAVVVRLRDRHERIIAQQRIVDWNAGTFDLPIEPWYPMLLRVEGAVLARDGVARGSAYRYFNVVKRHRGQFNFLIWDTPSGPTAPYAEESLARLGTTLHLRGGTPPRQVAAYGMAWVPYTTRILESHTKNGVMRPHCWNDEAKVQAYVTGLAEKYRGARQHGVFVYSLGDENHVRGSCLSPQCLAAYRRYLKEVYRDVKALNASWSSTYKSFDQVKLLKADDNQASEAKRQKNYPRWYDRQAFRSWNYVQYCKKFAAAYKKIDPKALTGFEGAGRFERGDDIDLFVRELGFWSPYPGTADEVLRSIAPKGFPRANWMGYRKDATSLLAKYWRMITRDCPSVWWWRWDCIGRFHGFLAPHLGPWPATRELVTDTQIVRDGLGTLLMRSEMLDSGMAILFSHPSVYASKVEHANTYGGYQQAHGLWHSAIRELGLNFRYVTDRQLRRGEFEAGRYRVLILARAEALGPKEAQAIRRFVEGGGSVLADVRPGIYDDHIRPRKTGILDDLFGIRRTGVGPATKGDGTLDVADQLVALKGMLCDPHVELAEGTAGGWCGDTPLMITHDVGDGGTLLLNFPISSYARLDDPKTPEQAAELFLNLAADVDVRPTILTLTDGRRTRNLETVRWRNGDLELVALFRHTGKDEDVQLRLTRPLHVRDLRHRRTFGPQRSYPTRIHGSRPTFLVLSPQPIAQPKAALSNATVAPGQRPKLRLQVPGAAGLHALRVRVTAPDGKAADWLDRVVIVGRETEEIVLPIAHNDPIGRWSIRVVDLFMEKPITLTLTVKRAG